MAKTWDELEHGNINERTCYFIMQNADVDGAHHKQWVLDQVLRRLAGAAYSWLIEMYEQCGAEWDSGIAP